MDDRSVWKFVAEIEKQDGSLIAHLFYVHAVDQVQAYAALKSAYPSADLLGGCAPASREEIAGSGGAFAEAETVRSLVL